MQHLKLDVQDVSGSFAAAKADRGKDWRETYTWVPTPDGNTLEALNKINYAIESR